MAMNSTQFKGVLVDQDKDEIIERYKRRVLINIIASKYDVGVDTIAKRLRSWGIKVRKGDYHRKLKSIKYYKRIFSPELRVKMAENSRINNMFIKSCKFEHTTEDQRLVSNILNHPIIV